MEKTRTVTSPTYVTLNNARYYVSGVDGDDVCLRGLEWMAASEVWLNIHSDEWENVEFVDESQTAEVVWEVFYEG